MVAVDLNPKPTAQEKARMAAFLRARGFGGAAHAVRLANIEAAATRDGYVGAVAALVAYGYTARRLGAIVEAYDVRPETREQIESLGAKFIDIDVGESGAGEGGYARELSDEAKQRQQELLSDELAKAHVIITTALIPCKPAPVLIPADVVERMREGSVIIDLAAATGGNCPLSEAGKVVEKHGVIIVGHTNYPSMVASDASQFYANNLFNLIGIMFDAGEEGPVLKNLEDDEITQAALVTEA